MKEKRNGIGLVRWWDQIRQRQARGLFTDTWLQALTTSYLVLNAKNPGDGIKPNEVQATLDMLGVPLVKPKHILSSL